MLKVFTSEGKFVLGGYEVDIEALFFEDEDRHAGLSEPGLDGEGGRIEEGFEIAGAQERFVKAGDEGHAGEFLGELAVGTDHILA